MAASNSSALISAGDGRTFGGGGGVQRHDEGEQLELTGHNSVDAAAVRRHARPDNF